MTIAKNGTFAAMSSALAPRPVRSTRAFSGPLGSTTNSASASADEAVSPPLMSMPSFSSSPRATGSIVRANLESGFTAMSASATVLAMPFGRFKVTSSFTPSPYREYPAAPITAHVIPTMTYVLSSICSYSSGFSMLV
eukprot:CAMPEP_0119225854 /NCGR_PEP_ID=MMETSP1327-20130426/34376_1 /TAXON_ID=38833 /ORGANISM="Micromonas pusilla, Strain RCC2306" /LENGTH=137 /DNA_ID=CAMNT_0007224135 /DNA_START=261 /DNA_END=674 /DNA_ORIENTATION=-